MMHVQLKDCVEKEKQYWKALTSTVDHVWPQTPCYMNVPGLHWKLGLNKGLNQKSSHY